MSDPNETYLGDAVYASFDGYQIKLRTGDGNAQVIYLEPAVYERLLRFVDELEAGVMISRVSLYKHELEEVAKLTVALTRLAVEPEGPNEGAEILGPKIFASLVGSLMQHGWPPPPLMKVTPGSPEDWNEESFDAPL